MSDATNNAVIAGKNLVSFSGVPMSSRGDILDMLMYADFFATQTWRPQSQWSSWIEYYRKQLGASGCRLISQIVKQPAFIKQAGELDNLGFGVTGSVRVRELMDLARRSFKAARLNEYARHFFESGSASGYYSTFQVVPCEKVGTDDILILICGLHASATVTSESMGGDWWTNREMVVRLAGGVYNFNSQAYAPHRQRIQTRLDEMGKFNIQQVSI